MNPDFLKYLQQITNALRSGITLGGDPLGELQKRASQIGEGFGTQFEHDRAQAGYTNALVKQYSGGEPGLRGQVRGQLDPHTQRAQQETMQNAAMLALGSLKPEASAENDLVFEHRSPQAGLKVLDAAYQGTGRAGAEAKRVDRVPMLHVQTPGSKVEQQFANDNLYHVRVPAGSIYDVAADPDGIVSKLRAKGNLDVNVMEKAIQKAGYKGYNNSDYYPEYVKLYGKHTPVDIRHAGNSDAEGVLAQESVRGATAHPLADAVKQEGKWFQRGDNEGTIFFRGQQYHGADGPTSAYEDALSKIPHNVPEQFGPKRTTVGPNEAVPPFWGTRLHSALTDKGGFTIDPETGADLTSGYSVGGGDKAGVLLKKPLADLKPTELQSFLNANKSKLQPGQAWGGWVQDGHVYVEPADQVGNLNEAQRLGNERGEQAIWDHANGKEIPLKAAKADAAAQTAAAQEPYRDVLDKWHTAWGDFTNGIAQLPKISQERGADVLAAKKFPSSNATQPWLASYLQRDIERPVGNAKKLGDVEDIAYKTFNTPQFKKWLAAGQGTGTWYDTRETMGRAIDALGEKLGPKAFNEFIDHLAASTAMSRPENNIRRASWWRALNLQGLLNPEELRSSTLAAPEGMGHIAQRAHHFATADLVEQGKLNALANPKPASFAENLKMNQRPVTFDTRMSNAALSTNPKMSLGLAGVRDDATPRKWAYAPIERAAQRVAAEAHARGDLDPVPRGVDPTATWQAQVWGGIGRADKTHMMSVDNPSFHAILDNLLARSAKLWGVSPTKANELFWKGQPLDLPLDASLLKGPSRKR